MLRLLPVNQSFLHQKRPLLLICLAMYQSLLLGRVRQTSLVDSHLQKPPLHPSKRKLQIHCSVLISLVVHHLPRLADHQAQLQHQLVQQFLQDRISSNQSFRCTLQPPILSLNLSLKGSHRSVACNHQHLNSSLALAAWMMPLVG